MSKIVEGLKYSESHEWVKVEDGVAVVGVALSLKKSRV